MSNSDERGMKMPNLKEEESIVHGHFAAHSTTTINNSVLIGYYAGADIETAEGVIIIGDNVRSLDKNQKDVLFIGDKFAIGATLFGKDIGMKDAIEELINKQ